jgi:hypothetical protein
MTRAQSGKQLLVVSLKDFAPSRSSRTGAVSPAKSDVAADHGWVDCAAGIGLAGLARSW